MPDLILAPHLPLATQTKIGPWQVVPFGDLSGTDVVPDELRRPVSRLIEAYELPSAGGSKMGAVAFPSGGYVGAPVERTAMRALGHALLAGVLSTNSSMAVPDDEQDPNVGWAVTTAENAGVYGHPLGEGDSYVIGTGVLVRVTSLFGVKPVVLA